MSHDLYSWGRIPEYAQKARACYWRSQLKSVLCEMAQEYGEILPYGNGRSYGDSCLSSTDHVLHMLPLNRFISADWVNGRITAESGLTLAELLALSIPKGWFLPVTPGTKYITLGGAVANDVHGKNHHLNGTFGRHVLKIGLIRTDRPPLTCSQQENPDIYKATIGGLGLTGIIEWVELQLIPIRSSNINATYVRFSSLNDFFAISSQLDKANDYTVAWIDCLARGKSSGRGIYMAGNHSDNGVLVYDNRPKLNVPFTPNFSVINNLSLRAFNSAYYRMHKAGYCNSVMSYEPFFYPLDRILNWNRIYGRRGFQQFQCVIPECHAEAATKELLNSIAAANSGSFLAVLKRFGNVASPGLLSFPMKGVTLALDFPENGDLNRRLFERLDTIVRQADGRIYPAKDAHMSGNDFRRAFPAWSELEVLRDPALCSRFWRRVTSK